MKKNVSLHDKVAKECFGEVEIEFRDTKTKEIVHVQRERNIVKIFAKEILSHSVVYDKVWDPSGGTGTGAWVDNDAFEDFRIKYILLGASYDANGIPLDYNDSRYYERDEVTGLYTPIRLAPGADYDGGLINAIPIDESNNRPLKRIENIYFQPTYQPAGTPLLQEDVRAINNILVVETVITEEEYNGFGLVESDHFTITEVALAAGKEITSVAACDVTPRNLFLDGPYSATASGGDTITLTEPTSVGNLVEGDQIKIVPAGTGTADEQVSPFYLILDKAESGSDITLDRTPMEGSSVITGDISIYRDTLRIFSHRILSSPAKKSSSFELTKRWKVYFT